MKIIAQDHLLWDASRAPDERRLQQLVKASGRALKCSSFARRCPNGAAAPTLPMMNAHSIVRSTVFAGAHVLCVDSCIRRCAAAAHRLNEERHQAAG